MRLILMLLFFCSCSDQVDWRFDGATARQEETTSFDFFQFDTRLTPELAVSGTLCEGGELVISEGLSFACERDQWLVTVDNVNVCNPDGCTDIEVTPTIAVLQPRTGGDPVMLFDIVPAIPATDEVENILDSLLVSFNFREDATVIFE